MPEAFDQRDIYSEETFTGLDLLGPEPRGRRFDACRFVECRITGTAFRTCAFTECVFEGCDLSNWNVEGLRMVEVSFNRCKLIGVAPGGLKPDPMTSFRFEECVLDYCNLARLKLPKLKMTRCSAREANFERAALSRADLRGTDFSGAIFDQTNLSGADLREARGYAIDPRTNTLKGARLSLPEALNLLTVLEVKLEWEDAEMREPPAQ